jgi:hypothetical protein
VIKKLNLIKGDFVMSTEDPNDYKNYQNPYWVGQAKINFELVRVNKKLIEALQTLIKLLQADRSAHGLKPVELTDFNALLTRANQIADGVASIDPPGCQGTLPY